MPSLRAVKDGETPPKPLSLEDAAAQGDERAMLVALKTKIAQTIASGECPARELASLSKRLIDIQREIASLDARTSQEASENAAEVPDQQFDAAAI